MKRLMFVFGLCLVISSYCMAAPGDEIPCTVNSVSSTFDATPAMVDAAFTCDGSGLDANYTHTNAYDHNMWLSGNIGDPNAEWVVYDLGALHEVGIMHVWNYNQEGETDRGVATMDVNVSQDNLTWESLGTYSLDRAPGSVPLSHQVRYLRASSTFRYVKFAFKK